MAASVAASVRLGSARREGGCNFNYLAADEGNAERCNHYMAGVGFALLAVLSSSVALAGAILTAQGASRLSRFARALKKYRPKLTIDPKRKTYAASMSLSF